MKPLTCPEPLRTSAWEVTTSAVPSHVAYMQTFLFFCAQQRKQKTFACRLLHLVPSLLWSGTMGFVWNIGFDWQTITLRLNWPIRVITIWQDKLTMTLKMTTTEIVAMPVTVNGSPIQQTKFLVHRFKQTTSVLFLYFASSVLHSQIWGFVWNIGFDRNTTKNITTYLTSQVNNPSLLPPTDVINSLWL